MGGISWKTHGETPQAYVSLAELADQSCLPEEGGTRDGPMEQHRAGHGVMKTEI